jgi:hypothetical protein
VNTLCDGCGQPLVGPGRSDRRYHGPACRKRAFLQREREAPVLSDADPEQALDREAPLEQALSETRLAVYVAAAAKSNWRAAAWLLERKYAERWGPGVRESEPGAPSTEQQRDDLARLREIHRRAEADALL